MGEDETEVSFDSSEHCFRTIVNQVPSGACVYAWRNESLEPLFLNKYTLQLFGMSEAEAMQALTDDPGFNLHPDDKASVIAMMDRAFSEPSAESNITARFMNASTKNYRWLRVAANVVEQPNGQKYAYIAYVDVNEEHSEATKLHVHDVMMGLAMSANNMMRVMFDIANRTLAVKEEDGKAFSFLKPLTDLPQSVLDNEFIVDGNRECYEQLSKLIEGTADEVTYDIKCTNPDISTDLWFRVTLVVVERGAAGKPALAAGIAHDITEFKMLQQRIDSEQMITNGSTSDVMWAAHYNLTTKKIISIDYNPQYHKLDSSTWFKYLEQAVVDEDQREHLHERCGEEALIKAYNTGTKSLEETYRIRDKAGRILWVKTTIELLHEPNGDLLATSVTRDVNDEVIRELTVDSLVHEEVDLLICQEMDTKVAHVIYSKYRNLPRIVPLKSLVDYRDHIATRLVDKTPQEIEEVLDLDYIVKSFETDPIFTYTYRVRSETGEVRAKKLRMFILPNSNNLLVCMVRDVTDLVRQEEQKRAELSAALDAAHVAEKARTDFFSRMSHDLRTPLNGILGSATLAAKQPCSPEVMEYLEIIGRSGTFMLQLINDILDLSKIEDENVVLYPSVLTKKKFMREIEMMFQNVCTNADIELCFQDNSSNHSIIADRKRLEQVFFNLLSNSVKFTPAGGRILFSVNDKPYKDNSLLVTFVVSDTGCGMSPEFQKTMFEPFKQERNAMSDSATGTGLGLPIVKNLVELMHGTIECKSAPGKGTVFTVVIPFKKGEEGVDEDTHTTSLDVSALAGKSVLLAEDNKINALIEERMLASFGMKVTCAEDGLEALSTFGDSTPGTFDLILMDMRMPRMDGLAAAKSIRALERPDAQTVPIIALTANAFDEDITASSDAGMNQHVSKPVDYDKLAAALLKHTGSNDNR